jgi:hypothetical protein
MIPTAPVVGTFENSHTTGWLTGTLALVMPPAPPVLFGYLYHSAPSVLTVGKIQFGGGPTSNAGSKVIAEGGILA